MNLLLKILTVGLLCGLVYSDYTLYFELQELKEHTKTYAFEVSALNYDINRVQDRCEASIGDLNEKLDLIETVLSQKF